MPSCTASSSTACCAAQPSCGRSARASPREAEAAFSIEKPWQSHGVGSALLDRTLLAARNRGIKLLHMACLADNERMQQLARKFDAELSFDFGSVVGEVEASRPTPLSLMREWVADGHGFATAMLELQSRMLRACGSAKDRATNREAESHGDSAFIPRLSASRVRRPAPIPHRSLHDCDRADKRLRPRRGRRRPKRATRTARSATRGTAASETARAPPDIRRPRWLDESRNRASVTCGVYLRPSGSSPTRCISRSCSACNSMQRRRPALTSGDHRARLAAAERGEPVEPQFEAAALHSAEQPGDLVRECVVDVADEAQRDVIVFGIDPARARQAAAQDRQRLGYDCGEFQDR